MVSSKDPHGVDSDPALAAVLDGLPKDLRGFATKFEREIRPSLMAREGERLKAASRARQFTLIGVVVGVVGAILGLAVFSEPIVAFLSGIAGMGAHGFGRTRINRLQKEAKAMIVSPIAQELNLAYAPDCGAQPLVHDLKSLRLLPHWDRSKFEDRLEGRRSEVDFEFFEAHLEQRRQTRTKNGTRTTWVTVFRGQCLRFNFHKTFYGETVVTRDAGIFNSFGEIGTKMKRARLEDPVFEKAFEVYTTDQVESRYLLTPDVMQRIVDLEQAFKGGKFRCAFKDGQLFIALEGGDLFETGSMFKPLDDPNRLRTILEDFGSVFRLIDTLGPRVATIPEHNR